MRMKRFFVGAAVVFLGWMAGWAGAELSHEQAYKTVTSIADLANSVISMKIQVYSTLTVLKGLKGGATDPDGDLAALSFELENLTKNSLLLSDHSKQLTTIGSEYSAALNGGRGAVEIEAGEMEDESSASGGTFDHGVKRLQKDMESAVQHFEPVVSGLRNVEAAIKNDPGGSSQLASGSIAEIEDHARMLYLELDKISDSCVILARSIAPEDVNIDEMIADEVEEELGMVEMIEEMGTKMPSDEAAAEKEMNAEKEAAEGEAEQQTLHETVEVGEATGTAGAGIAPVADPGEDIVMGEEEGEEAVAEIEEISENDDLLPAEELLELEPPVEPAPVPEIEWPEETEE
ncbi:MAG TPA: hypothetical protein P5246_00350 [Candidatus Omnitrophota bacterium]|nr:hypothetical protein [Candidatus Omnitrophota bacterium]